MIVANEIKRWLAGEISQGKLLELVPNRYDLIGAFAHLVDEMSGGSTRRLSWEQLTARVCYWHESPWKNRKGETKVHASLKGAAFVMHTFWLKDPDLDRPETQAAILLVMNRELQHKKQVLSRFL